MSMRSQRSTMHMLCVRPFHAHYPPAHARMRRATLQASDPTSGRARAFVSRSQRRRGAIATPHPQTRASEPGRMRWRGAGVRLWYARTAASITDPRTRLVSLAVVSSTDARRSRRRSIHPSSLPHSLAMSAFGRDLIGNVNCGTANPLMQMAGQMQGMGAQVSSARRARSGMRTPASTSARRSHDSLSRSHACVVDGVVGRCSRLRWRRQGRDGSTGDDAGRSHPHAIEHHATGCRCQYTTRRHSARGAEDGIRMKHELSLECSSCGHAPIVDLSLYASVPAAHGSREQPPAPSPATTAAAASYAADAATAHDPATAATIDAGRAGHGGSVHADGVAIEGLRARVPTESIGPWTRTGYVGA
jgi:hypothetical protein